MLSSNNSLVIAFTPKYKCEFREAVMLFFTFYQKKKYMALKVGYFTILFSMPNFVTVH